MRRAGSSAPVRWTVIDEWLHERTTTVANNPFIAPTPAPNSVGHDQWMTNGTTWLNAAPTDPRVDPRCALPGGGTVDERRWTSALATITAELRSTYEEAHHDELDHDGAPLTQADPATVAAGLADWYQTRADQLTAEVPTEGPILRLTANGRPTRVIVPPAGGFAGVPTSIAPQVISQAITYGGLAEGDPRTGNDGGLVGVQISLALDGPDLAATYPLVNDPAADPNVVNLTCGTPGAWLHKDMAVLWDRMCADAVAAGITARGWGGRSHAAQIRLRTTNGCPDVWTARASSCRVPTAIPGTSNHERGVALDLENMSGNHAFRHFIHDIVGCYTRATNTYVPYPAPIDYEAYANAIDAGATTITDTVGGTQQMCGDAIPVKRVNTYGMVLGVCTNRGEDQMTSARLRCLGKLEDWHIEPGVPLLTLGTAGGVTDNCAYNPQDPLRVGDILINPDDRQTVAQATYTIFYCEARAAGLEALPPTPSTNGTGPAVFTNKAQQVAAEAVVVGFCESGFTRQNMSSNNPWGYGGVFQFGDSEPAKWIPGGNKFDIAANITGAARYYLAGHGKGRWDGWGPWAVVNTDYGGPNSAVDYPILPRFTSTEPGFEGRRTAGSLPGWAIDPFTSPLGTGSCKNAYTGAGWQA